MVSGEHRMRVIAIGGNPGSGKSTLMRRLLNDLQFPKSSEQLYELVPGHKNRNVVVLGKYDEDVGVFGGTDKMSMAVQPKAIEYLETSPGAVVIYEGDRLFTGSFLEHCEDKYDLSIIHLSTTKEVREERYKERGSNQDETWLKGRESKISNILTNFVLMDCIETFPNNDENEQTEVLEHIKKLIIKSM
jgi:dephospho-CoA kinase